LSIPRQMSPVAMRTNGPTYALVALLALLISSCSSPTSPRERAPTVAFALRNLGSIPPTPAQLAGAHRSLHDHLIASGYKFADTPASAQFIVHAEFTPSSVDPASGHVRIIGVEPTDAMKRTLTATGSDQEEREYRRRLQEIERWIELQSKTRFGEGTN
jgi:hypothetical protein